MSPIRKGALLLLPLLAAVALAACGPAAHKAHPAASKAAASARAYARTAAFRHAEHAAQARTQACAKTSGTHITALIRCVAPKGTFPAVLRCVDSAAIASFTHPIKAAEAAAPACVARQETRTATR